MLEKMSKTNIFDGQISAGKQIQVVYNETREFIKGDDEFIPWDDSIPHHNEGVRIVGVTVRPKTKECWLLVEAVVHAVEQDNHSDQITVALFRDDESDALATSSGAMYGPLGGDSGSLSSIPLRHMFQVKEADKVELFLRAGQGGGIININGSQGERRLGGSLASSITVTEFAS